MLLLFGDAAAAAVAAAAAATGAVAHACSLGGILAANTLQNERVFGNEFFLSPFFLIQSSSFPSSFLKRPRRLRTAGKRDPRKEGPLEGPQPVPSELGVGGNDAVSHS